MGFREPGLTLDWIPWSTSSFLLIPSMVLIFEGNSEHVAHAWREIGVFGQKNRCVTSLNLIKYRSNNKDCYLRAHLFLIPSNIRTVGARGPLDAPLCMVACDYANSLFESLQVFLRSPIYMTWQLKRLFTRKL